ncbi:hypothetical protein EYF80_037698 [Liparis tanakae]|uniref:Uncharacterized protein n=1 Tax=Liparis tanakae TaxID=230148 RepID=A0A4Z2GFM9_9TELE|nr:hypothetical protein EYF80_037698 [Liparis tanakae]
MFSRNRSTEDVLEAEGSFTVFRKDYPVVFTVFTSDDLSSCVGLALEERQHHGRLVRTVHAGLDRLLEHCVDRSGTKVVRELLHQLPVETTFEPLLWLLSAGTGPALSLVSGGGAVTAGAPRRDCTT